MREYLLIIFAGLLATSLYNFFSCLLRALGNSTVPLVFLAVSAILNIAWDLLFVAVFHWGIAGAAYATIFAQYVSGIGILLYRSFRCRSLFPERKDLCFDGGILKEIAGLSSLTCLQQSVMNFGILMVQGLVNSFGATTMAAFAAAVKIDTFAYLPVQDFGNAYSTFIAQNYGAGNKERIHRGTKESFAISTAFQPCDLSAGLCLRGTAHADLRELRRDGGHRLRHPLSQDRGRVLFWNRLPVPALRILQGDQEGGDVCGAYSDLPRNPCVTCLRALCHIPR